jgi:uncharacterized protein (TIGR01777 family)
MDSTTPARRVLLSGASGMLGTALRQSIESAGDATLQLVRRPPSAVNEIRWNPANRELTHPEAFEDLTAAIHLSGANLAARRWTAAYKREIVESRVATTKALATSLARLKRPPKLLMVASAVGFYGDRGSELLDETSGPGQGFMADVCKRWEAASGPASDAGISVVHLRFGVVLNAQRGALAKFLPIFKLGLGGMIGNGEQYMSWISEQDLVGAVLFLLKSENASGAYNVTTPNPVTNAQFTRLLAAQLRRPAVFNVPAFAARAVFGEMAKEALLASTRAYPARLVGAGYQFQHPSLVHALPVLLSPLFKQ